MAPLWTAVSIRTTLRWSSYLQLFTRSWLYTNQEECHL